MCCRRSNGVFVFDLYRLSLISSVLLLLIFWSPVKARGQDWDNSTAGNLAGSSANNHKKPIHFVLVHGYSAGAWTWYKISSLLSDSGYLVTAPDLAGAGVDFTNHSDIRTFDDYNRPLIRALSSLPSDESVILVGYSAGGLSVTDASHKYSNKIQLAVYLAATMLKKGFVTRHDLEIGAPGFAYKSGRKPVPPPNNCTVHINAQEDQALSRLLFRSAVPLDPLIKARFEGGRPGKVPRVYIKTLCDGTLLPSQQDAMIRKWRPSKVYALPSDHGVIGSNPFALFGLLVKLAASLDSS